MHPPQGPRPVTRAAALCKATGSGYWRRESGGARLRNSRRASRKMLEGMRRASKNWLGKILVGILFSFLILSFAIWGIGDIFRGFGVGTVAKVGDTEITTESFRQAYQTQLQNWQREARRAITNDEARAAGLDRQVLQRLDLRGRARPARQGSRPRHGRSRHRAGHRQRPLVPWSHGAVRASALQRRAARGRLRERAALSARTAHELPAPRTGAVGWRRSADPARSA